MSETSQEQNKLERELNDLMEKRAALIAAINQGQSNQASIQNVTNSMLDQNTSSRSKNLDSQQANLEAMINAGAQMDQNNEKQGVANKASEFFNKVLATTGRLYESIIQPGMKYFNSLIRLDFVYGALAKSAAEFSSRAREMAQAQQESIDAFGKMGGPTQRRFREFMSSATKGGKGLAETGRSLSSIYGIGYADSFKALTEVYKAFGNEAQALNEKIQATAGQLILLKESLGISYEAQKKLLQITDDVEEGYAELTKTLVSGSKAFGVNIKDVGKAFNDIALDVKNFGYMTKKEMADTSVFVARLGLEVSELTSFAAGFDTFEGAAEKVSKLSAAFGIQLDTMDLVMEDNPAKKLDMVREALERSGRSIKDIAGNRREINYLAESIGLPIEKIMEMSEMSVDEFGFAKIAEETESANKKMSEQDALNEIAKNMKKSLDMMKDLEGTGFFANFIKGFRDMFEQTTVFKVGMARIERALREFYNLGKDTAGMVSELFYKVGKDGLNKAPLGKMFEAFVGYFETIGAAALEVRGNLRDVFKYIGDFLSGKELDVSSEKIMDLIFNPFIKAFSSATASQGLLNVDIRNALVNIGSLMIDVLGGALVSASNALVKMVENMFLKDVGNALLEDKTINKFMKTIKSFALKLGTVFSNVFRAGSGLFAYFFGGNFNGKSVSFAESAIGGPLNRMALWFYSGGADRIIGKAVAGITDMFLSILDPSKSGGRASGIIKAVAFAVNGLFNTLLKIAVVELNVLSASLVNIAYRSFVGASQKLVQKAVENPIVGTLMAAVFPGIAVAAGIGATRDVGDIFDVDAMRKKYQKEFYSSANVMEEEATKAVAKAKSEGKAITFDAAVAKEAQKVSSITARNNNVAVANIQNLETVVNSTNEKIIEMRESLDTIPMAKLSAVVGTDTGTKLKAAMPEKVVVSTEKIQIRMSLNVSMDAKDIATSLASGEEYFFEVNPFGSLANDESAFVGPPLSPP